MSVCPNASTKNLRYFKIVSKSNMDLHFIMIVYRLKLAASSVDQWELSIPLELTNQRSRGHHTLLGNHNQRGGWRGSWVESKNRLIWYHTMSRYTNIFFLEIFVSPIPHPVPELVLNKMDVLLWGISQHVYSGYWIWCWDSSLHHALHPATANSLFES